MKVKNIQKLFLMILGVLLLNSCKKESENIFTMFKDVTITFNNSDPRCVTDYKLVNDKDEVWIDFTLNSASEDMYSYAIETSAGTQAPSRIIYAISDPAQRRSFSFIYKIPNTNYPSLRDGKQTFRVMALNQKGIFIGDGYKKVTIDVNPSYTIFANRDIYLPDTVAKVQPSFLSLTDATTYSYTNGAANAAKIDFGIYRTMSKDAQGNTVYTLNLYNTTAPATTFPIYDVSSWTPKRATKFSAPVSGQGTAFTNTAISGSTIETLARARTINLNATTTGIVEGSAIFFLTPEGKYGMILVNRITSDLQRRPFINVSIKMQR